MAIMSREGSFAGSTAHGSGAMAALPALPRTTTMFACITTLINTLLGVSIVGVAGGFARAGCAVGSFYLVLFACLSGNGLHLLARSSLTVSEASRRKTDEEEEVERSGVGKGVLPPSSFRAVALVGAPRWAFLIDVAVALKCFGVATSYLVVVGDLMPAAMTDIIGDSHPDSFLLQRRLWVTAGFILVAPLSFSRTLGALKYTATLAIGLVIFLVGMVMSFWLLPWLDACPGDETAVAFDEGVSALAADFSGYSSADDVSQSVAGSVAIGFDGGIVGEEGGDCVEGSNVVGSVRNILQTLPLFVFCFTCHQNVFTICNEIVNPTPARIDAVIVFAMVIAAVTHLSLCWGTYLTFGVGIEGDLLETYPHTGLLTTARVCVSILVTSCYPLQAHPSRLCITSTWNAFAGELDRAYSSVAGTTGESDATSPAPPTTGNGYTSVQLGNSSDGDESSHGIAVRKGAVVSHERCAGGDAISRLARASSGSASSRGSDGGLRGATEEGGGRRVGLIGAADMAAGPVTGDNDVESLEQAGLLSALQSGDLSVGVLSDDAQGSLGGGGGRGQHPGERAGGVDKTEEALSGPVQNISVGASGGVADERGGEEEAFWTSLAGFRHVCVTAMFLGLSYAIAMAVDDLGVLLEVVGATGSTTITFILPGLLYLKVHPERHPKRILAALQLTVGVLIIPVALTFIALGDSPESRR